MMKRKSTLFVFFLTPDPATEVQQRVCVSQKASVVFFIELFFFMNKAKPHKLDECLLEPKCDIR